MHDQLNIVLILLTNSQTASDQGNVTSPSRIPPGHGWEEIWVLHPCLVQSGDFGIAFGHFGSALLFDSVLVEGPAVMSDVLLASVGRKGASQTCARQTREALPPLVVLPQPSGAT